VPGLGRPLSYCWYHYVAVEAMCWPGLTLPRRSRPSTTASGPGDFMMAIFLCLCHHAGLLEAGSFTKEGYMTLILFVMYEACYNWRSTWAPYLSMLPVSFPGVCHGPGIPGVSTWHGHPSHHDLGDNWWLPSHVLCIAALSHCDSDACVAFAGHPNYLNAAEVAVARTLSQFHPLIPGYRVNIQWCIENVSCESDRDNTGTGSDL